jgi:hypothetical protein
MGLTAVADRTGNYDGCEIFWSGSDGIWKGEWLAEEYPAAAKAIVYHKHRQHPEVAIARWHAYAGQAYNYETKKWELTDFWERMPDWMLAKCAKAAALRGAFPDPLSNVFIHEELESNITEAETEPIPAEEAKVAENQRRDAELRKTGLFPGARFVDQKADSRQPTPEEALEPAFNDDKIPSKPAKEQPVPAQTVVQAKTMPPDVSAIGLPTADDLDMSPAPTPTEQAQEALAPPLAISSPAGGAEKPSAELSRTPLEKPAFQEPPPPGAEPSWKAHVILGVTHVKFHKRKVRDLNVSELGTIETQWLPVVREQWEDANDAQRADAAAFEAAIAYHKMAKPW